MIKFIIFFFVFCYSNNLLANELNNTATIKIINKVSGKFFIYNSDVGKSLNHKNLEITIENCIKNNINYDEYAAYIVIINKKKNRLLFNSWILSHNISISQFSHPIYSVKLLTCNIN